MSELSAQELKVLRLLIQGDSNQKVANTLDVSVRTIETRRHDAMTKLGARSAVQMGYLFAQWESEARASA